MNSKATFASRFFDLCGDSSQADIAKAIGVSRATVGYYKNGDRSPDVATLSRIAQHFNVSADYLIGLSDAKQPENSDIVKRLGLSEKTVQIMEDIFVPLHYNDSLDVMAETGAFIPIFRTLSVYMSFLMNTDPNEGIIDFDGRSDFLEYQAARAYTDYLRELKELVIPPIIRPLVDKLKNDIATGTVIAEMKRKGMTVPDELQHMMSDEGEDDGDD